MGGYGRKLTPQDISTEELLEAVAHTNFASAVEMASEIAVHAALNTVVHGITAFGETLTTAADAPAGRVNLGLHGAAVLNVGTTPGTVAEGGYVDQNVSSGTAPVFSTANMSINAVAPLTASTFWLGVGGVAVETAGGGAALLNVGTAAGTVAAGDDTRIATAMLNTANLADISSAASGRVNLGLHGAAVLNVGTVAGTVMAGDDVRVTWNTVSKNDNYTATASDFVVCTTNTFWVTLPSGPADADRVIVKNRGTGTITVAGNGDTIDGAVAVNITAQYESLSVRSDGTTWDIY